MIPKIMKMMAIMIMMMPMMMTISVLGSSGNGLEANQSGTHKAHCANKLLCPNVPKELGNISPSSSLIPPLPTLPSACADTVIGRAKAKLIIMAH